VEGRAFGSIVTSVPHRWFMPILAQMALELRALRGSRDVR
jgi:large-conductance mechanosensitive channel